MALTSTVESSMMSTSRAHVKSSLEPGVGVLDSYGLQVYLITAWASDSDLVRAHTMLNLLCMGGFVFESWTYIERGR